MSNVELLQYALQLQILTNLPLMFVDMIGKRTLLPDISSRIVQLNMTTGSTALVTIPSTHFELANFLIALVLCYYRTVSVFWQSNRVFAIIYWVQSVAAFALHLLSLLGFQIMFMGRSTVPEPESFILNDYALTSLYIISNGVLFISSWCVFHFGYGTVLEQIRNYLKQLSYHLGTEGGCGVYVPHTLALSFILVYVGCNAPIMYDYVTMYSFTTNKILIAHLTACVVYMLLWIILWFLFTVKQNWGFKLNEISLKRYAILQNRQRVIPDPDEEVMGEAMHPHPEFSSIPIDESFTNSEDNLSNSTTSTINGGTPRSANGILLLSHKIHSRQRRKTAEQKVQFQEATKIVIETNLDSDLDTIPESDAECADTIPESDAECADSAMFSGSGGSNDSNGSRPTGAVQHPNLNNLKKINNRDQILNPQTITNTNQRIWSSTGDLDELYSSTHSPISIDNGRPRSVISDRCSNYITTPFSPRTLTPNNKSVSFGYKPSKDRSMTSAV